MTQELAELRTSILEGRYQDALTLLDELDGMSKKATVRAIKSFAIRMLIALIKNHIEQRLTNSWAASIRGSILEIKDLNLKENQTSYYIKSDEWNSLLTEAIEVAIRDASVEVLEGAYSPFQLSNMVKREEVMATAQDLLSLIYTHSALELPEKVDEKLSLLPGGKTWKEGRQ
ncbi:hypothetical protein J0895_08285 [Phormidium pseudopriestleyi FRX01]|uniref:DUF29 family protein n=1 Tax=Phormidium pseudopriestleyi FRX01 TaxID=1759528 RepID=A0ABS3FPV3_9CYAN|nr:hypothetical protein [Phormidium pseudopriestleyi]MBO0349100.1 hypothetical protein [Phormidium pseudopriestleyi FRX01]